MTITNGKTDHSDEEEGEQPKTLSVAAVNSISAGRMGTIGMPLERSSNFGASVKRLFKLLSPRWPTMLVVLFAAVTSAVLTVLGPRILGRATDVIFRGAAASFFGGGGPKIDFARLHHYLYLAMSLYF